MRVIAAVPVWITLGSWDPSRQQLRSLATEAMKWMLPALRNAARYGAHAADRLFDEGRVVLFLDGLDEMPEKPRRSAMRAIAVDAARLRVVISCQPGAYTRPTVQGRAVPQPAVLRLEPLSADTVATYLVARRPGADRPAWQDLADRIRSQPRGVAAVALATPLFVSLALAAYADPEVDSRSPRELLEYRDDAQVRAAVIDRFLHRIYPSDDIVLRARQEQQRPGHSRRLGRRIALRRLHRRGARELRFLTWVAHRMGTNRDLRWWQMITWISWDATTGALFVTSGLCVTAFLLLGLAVTGGAETYWTICSALLAFALGSLMGVGGYRRLSRSGAEPQALRIRVPNRHDSSRMAMEASTLALPYFIGITMAKGPFAGIGGSLGIFALGLFKGNLADDADKGLLGFWSRPAADGTRETVARSYSADARTTAARRGRGA